MECGTTLHLYYAQVCDREFSKEHIGVNLFSMQHCLHEYRLIILYEKGTKFVSRCLGTTSEDSFAIARNFDDS